MKKNDARICVSEPTTTKPVDDLGEMAFRHFAQRGFRHFAYCGTAGHDGYTR